MHLVFEIIAFEPFAVISPLYEQNICDLQSTSYQRVVRFRI